MMKKNIFVFFLFASLISKAQNNLNLVPMPAEVKMGKGFCVLKEPLGFLVVDYEDNSQNDGVEDFKNYLVKNCGIKQRIIDEDSHSYGLPTEIFVLIPEKPRQDGYYELEITANKIHIKGSTLGTFYAFETLKQLIQKVGKNYTIPCCTIKDYARFSYRGMHLDVSRHFFPVAFVKKYIDYLAAYKFNTFHWHLTDDQGWRIEIKKYPLLTQVGSCRAQTLVGNYGTNKYDGTKYCGYYTQQQIKEIVKYAADRYITVIPEIEMPGHAVAALTSYPYLGCTKGPYKVWETWGVADDVFCAGNDSTYKFIENVLDEVMQLFPSKYIHVGGDECPKVRWKTCPVCQKRIKDEGLKDEHALQSYFVTRIEKYLNSKGRKIIGWDEILEGGLAANATVMSWRGEEGGIAAAKQNHDVIMTPGSNCYFDHSQSKNEDSLTIGGYLPLENVYNYEPIPPVLNAAEGKHILGAQGNLWTEYITNPSKVEYMIFPRMAALSEVLWTPKEKKNWTDFEKRLPRIFERLDKQKINYSKAYYDLKVTVLPTENYDGVIWKVETKNKNGTIIMSDSSNDHGSYAVDDYINRKSSNFTDVHHGLFLGKESPEFLIKSNFTYSNGITTKTKEYNYVKASVADTKRNLLLNIVDQKLFFNKATGKKITLTDQPSKSYSGDGAFTLVNGVQNEKGFTKSNEFLGFQSDCEAIIDLGKNETCSKVVVHALTREASWIWQPSRVTVFYSTDGINYKSLGLTEDFITSNNMNGTMTVNFAPVDARYIKVWIANEGKIPDGNPGAGYVSWLFVDEIEVE